MKKWLLLIAVAAAFLYQQFTPVGGQAEQGARQTTVQTDTRSAGRPSENADGQFEQILQQAFENRQSDIQVEGFGRVVKTLPDDNKGSRHQRFILKLSSGQTLLVAHNIDLADKIKGLKKGDTVGFYGEYEWTEQGGVIHWTHHDPKGRHADGWLEHNGKRYQ
ncbi:DUF3465 domain-containing protein [Bergeriella denitrificans]|uniref:Protein of uncharacterized function (DUF3465) n=1 Tax=Bergeriella denitrificans TaxID=494 RepID=A0A378UDL9_BERDE|nr:DUF3465 domain-containing protein [Bergeriella denitrificans]STZ75494.1 Protein of uncharacterised function (DUF3465) [Bergeriella denitrificans]